MSIPALFSRDYRLCLQITRSQLGNNLHTVRPLDSTDQSQTQRTDWELTDSMADLSSMLSALMSCLLGGEGDMNVLCHTVVTQTCHWCLLWWPLTWGTCCREAQLVWGLYILPLIIISLWHVTATGITLQKWRSCKPQQQSSEDECCRKPTQEGLVCNPSTSVQCRQVALKMNSSGRAGRAGRNAQRQWH